ncbi:L-serine ammonia-lyase [Acidicapsa acidisoli]|uniref:L-serine ammonia-lyase n=1 Tax=Acidicapsa acidisoli TaxID=1615681 RepID=UPI0021E05C22|nr:L-serine ammonia-lyase [Acidicapsa acidisoli]
MTSLFDLYKIGVGPSSSHTMGPMTAAFRFADDLAGAGRLASIHRLQVDLYGSLALTGIGHATDRAILLGLSGNFPAGINPEDIEPIIRQVRTTHRLTLAGKHAADFHEDSDLLFHRDQMFPPGATTQHPNGMRFTAFDQTGTVIECRTWFSIGGGFIVEDGQETTTAALLRNPVPYPFRSAAELLDRSHTHSLSIAEIMLANEVAILPDQDGAPILAQERIRQRILSIWHAMQDCVARGIATEGILPGGLNVRRRAHRLAERLRERQQEQRPSDPLAPLDWVTVYAMAVNEENAAGCRVVTAPTNGAAGVVPAVAHYYNNFIPGANEEGILRFFLTSAAIGILYKENASISGAEVGCQGEVGVACSMAAGGLAAALGGTAGQIEHAAEIAMEHNLGMTCDPIGGLVQIPCIERNAMGAVKAVHATRIAMQEPEEHKVSLDQVIRTMYLTGLDMQSRYKETSLAGLALNIIEC